jgi:class 3 adenylate cyclase
VARLQHKSLDAPDEVRTFPLGRLEIFQLDDIVIGRTIFDPGWQWSKHVKPIAGTERCQYHHVGVALGGTLKVVMEDGTTTVIGPNSAYEIPPGHDAWVVGDETWNTVDFAGMRSFARSDEETGERILASILFTDLVGSTATLERLGDARWRDLLAQFNERTQFEVDRFRGRTMTQTGDGILALFDGAERAVRCGAAICQEAVDLGLAARAGVHTGEVQVTQGNVRGVAVHAAARIVSLAGASEVMISATTHDLVAGSNLRFADRGSHELKGLTGPRQIFALEVGSQARSAE